MNAQFLFDKSISAKVRSILLIPFEDQELPGRIGQFYPQATLSVLWKKDLAGLSFKKLLSRVRSRRSDLVIASLHGSTVPRSLSSVNLLLSLSGSPHAFVRTGESSLEQVHRAKVFGETALRAVSGVFIILRTYLLVTFRLLRLSPGGSGEDIPHPRTKKVLFLRTDLGGSMRAGGSISHVKGMVRAFCKAGYEVVYVSDAVSEVLPSEVLQLQIKPSPDLDFFDELQLIAYNLTVRRKLRTLVARHGPGLIYQRHSLFSFAGGEAARKFHLPLILEANASEVWVKKKWSRLFFEHLATRCELLALRSATKVAVISKRVAEQFQPYGISGDRMLLNPNGVDPEEFHPDIDGTFVRERYSLGNRVVVGFIGTFTGWHGVETLFDAASLVCERDSSISFLFIGDGDLKSMLEKRVGAFTDRMIFTGLIPHPEAPRYLAACDILVSPHKGFDDGTAFFGSPTKLFEYMAMGKAIIASRLEQIAEVIHDGENGLHMEPGNTAQLAELILKLAGNENLRQQLGARARLDVVAHYTWDKNVERIGKAIGPLNP
jgi:glycosyltransferase involved in cell wall biosynthesis